MLYLPKSSLVRVTTRPIVPGGVVVAEGQALISNVEGGTRGVTQSNGSAGEVFAGVAVFERAPLDTLPRVNDLTVEDTGHTITLDRTPVGGTSAIRVVDTTTNTVLVAGDPANAGEYSISGSVITVNTARDGNSITVYYRFSPTVLEAKNIQGDIRPGGTAASLYGRIGAITIGDVYTTEFDQTVDWTVDNIVVRTGANGRFTIGGSGAIVPCSVIAAPTQDSPFLGLSLT